MNKAKVTCVFCRCLISINGGDKSRFRDHMNNEHDVRVDAETMEVLMVVTIMTEGERKKLINDFSVKVADRLRPKNVNKVSVTPEFDNKRSLEYEEEENNKIVLSDSEEEENYAADNKYNRGEMDRASNMSRNTNIGLKETQEKEADDPLPKRIEREGVLKCKYCPKYIRQSQMIDHKNIFHQDEMIREGSHETERLLSSPSDMKKVSPAQNAVKRKESQMSDDSDEDWNPSLEQNEIKKKRIMISCTLCKKRFGSKMTLTHHERMAHRERMATGRGL